MAAIVSFFSSDKEREHSDLKRNHSLALENITKAKKQLEQAVKKQTHEEEESAALRQKNQALQKELQSCQEELRACKDDLFRLQPTSHVPDSQIAGQFEDLVVGICTWIDAEVSRYSDRFQEYRPGTCPKLLHHGCDRWVGKLLARYPETAGEHITRCLVQRQLCETLLNDKIYLFGLDSGDSAILELMEGEMRQLQPPRGKRRTLIIRQYVDAVSDPKTIRAWRSESLTSLAASAIYSESLAKKHGLLANEAFQGIQAFFPIVKDSRTSLTAFYEKIIKPAINLALAIQQSPIAYSFRPCMTDTPISERLLLSRNDLADVKVIDVTTGKTLKADSSVVENAEGMIGEQIALLSPALWRCIPGEKEVLLTREVILAELFYPLSRRRANTTQNSRRQTSDSEDHLA